MLSTPDPQLHALCDQAGLQVVEETTFSRFSIILATKQPPIQSSANS